MPRIIPKAPSNALATKTGEGEKLVNAAEVPVASVSEKDTRLRAQRCLCSFARAGRVPQAKRPAITPEEPTISAAGGGSGPITLPLPPQDQRAVAPKEAGVQFDVSQCNQRPINASSDPLASAGRSRLERGERSRIAAARVAEQQAAKANPVEAQTTRRPRPNITISSGNWSFSGRISDAVADLTQMKMDDFLAPARTLEADDGDESWVVVFGSDARNEAKGTPADVLLGLLSSHAKSLRG